MEKINRRDFLKLVGSGSAAIAGGAMLTGIGLPGQGRSDAFTFRAVAGLPTAPLPSYASYVLEGGVNLAAGSGVVTKTVFAGPPDAMSNLTLPGLTRVLRITGVRQLGSILELTAQAADPFQLLRGESPTVTVRIDRSTGQAQAHFLDSLVELQVQNTS